MPDQIIDAVMARGLHADACRSHPLVGWFVLQDLPEYPGKLAAYRKNPPTEGEKGERRINI